MRKFLRTLGKVVLFPFRILLWVILAPFRLLRWLVAAPIRAYRRAHQFLNAEPDERPLLDTVAAIVQDSQARQSIWAHIEALRGHLFRGLIALAITVTISAIFTQQMSEFLARPIGGLSALKAIEVTESIGVYFRIALTAGITLALPYLAFEFWFFLAPGLRPRSKKFGLIGIPLATLLFVGGMAFAYFVMLPTALPFLLNFMGIQAELRPHSYFTFVTGLMFWIGVAFEFPLVVYVLTAVGFVKPQVLKEQWRVAIVVIAILAAAITPTVDPVNMALVMLPMTLLYFLSIGLSRIAYAGRIKARREQQSKG